MEYHKGHEMFLWFSFRRVDWLTGHLLFFSSKRFFVTTFERHQTQLQVLDELKATIEKDGFFIDKTYVKEKTNLYSHPAMTQFNKTTDSANKTVVTLMKIITTLRDRQNGGESDPLLDLLSGRTK